LVRIQHRFVDVMLASMVLATTTCGTVRGVTQNGVAAFRGIPYAAPPLGHLRFRAPQPAATWRGVRDATEVAAACPQPALPRLFDKLDPSATKFVERYDEDCLTVNVFTPGLGSQAKPVLVWLHGGWFSVGSGNEPAYDGSHLCEIGDVVVATINHRLGALGFLSLAGIGGRDFESSGNSGILDIVAALEWIRDNIAAFGGDPGRVTVFGESGGASKVSMLLGVRGARGLFHRAILQSGPMLRAVSAARAANTTKAFLAELGAESIAELQAAPVSELVRAQSTVLGGPLGGTYGDGHRMAPTIDGIVLDRHPFEPAASEAARGVPLLIGTCRDEATMMVATVPGINAMSPEQQFKQLADNVFGHDLDDLVPNYTLTRPGAAVLECFLAAAADQLRIGGIVMAERAVAAGAPVYMYRLDHVPSVYGGTLGALHTLDVGFVFANTDAGAGITSPNRGLYLDPDVGRITAEMSQAWIAFARNGDPSHPGLPAWPSYDEERRATMIFGPDTAVIDDPDGDERLLWQGRASGM
jgi:para-nitrobenzyl esterase